MASACARSRFFAWVESAVLSLSASSCARDIAIADRCWPSFHFESTPAAFAIDDSNAAVLALISTRRAPIDSAIRQRPPKGCLQHPDNGGLLVERLRLR